MLKLWEHVYTVYFHLSMTIYWADWYVRISDTLPHKSNLFICAWPVLLHFKQPYRYCIVYLIWRRGRLNSEKMQQKTNLSHLQWSLLPNVWVNWTTQLHVHLPNLSLQTLGSWSQWQGIVKMMLLQLDTIHWKKSLCTFLGTVSTFKCAFWKATILCITAKCGTADVKTLRIILVQS